ncbi:Y-family DNA polymerase [Isoalcanivorax beigongshangi]|uniref:DNA polymerase Y family protein n=1 Tax=Isoalcanivorax beigongshangi TaxID=3238810 RepID=A0ABV4AHW5_9GAMM
MNNRPPPLWLALRLPHWGLEVLPALAGPQALADPRHILLTNAAASAAGIRPGMQRGQALALCDGLQLRQRDPAREQRRLQRLARQLQCFTPQVCLPAAHPLDDDRLDQPWQLWLELGGCLRLFGGAEALLVELLAQLSQSGHHWQAGLGHTPRAAHCLATAPWSLSLQALGRSTLLDAQGLPLAEALQPALAALPLAQLPLHSRLREALTAPGFRTLGQLLALPGDSLGPRFGAPLLDWLQRLSGQQPDPQQPLAALPVLVKEQELDPPLTTLSALLPWCQRLLQQLMRDLRRHQVRTRSLRWRLWDHLGEAPALVVRRSSADPEPGGWLQLTERHLEQRILRAPVLRLRLESGAAEAGPPLADSLFPDPHAGAGRSALLDRLATLPGLSLRQFRPQPDPLPELLQQADAASAEHAPSSPRPGDRELPLWRLPAPQPLASDARGRPLWQRRRLQLWTRERRLASHWWQHAQQRQYYLARSHDGAWCWLFRTEQGWFLHGFF